MGNKHEIRVVLNSLLGRIGEKTTHLLIMKPKKLGNNIVENTVLVTLKEIWLTHTQETMFNGRVYRSGLGVEEFTRHRYNIDETSVKTSILGIRAEWKKAPCWLWCVKMFPWQLYIEILLNIGFSRVDFLAMNH